MNRKLLLLLIVVGLVGACVVAYWNAPRGTFIWDDINLIVLDYQIKSWNFLTEVFQRDFFGFSDDNRKYGYYRPLITVSYSIDWHLWGVDPAGFHRSNILFHIICTILLFFIFYRLLNRTLLIPTLAGLIFAVNPIHTESVTWIAGRTDPLAAIFFFASLLCFMAYAERVAAARGVDPPPPGTPPHAAEKRQLPLLILTLLFFAIGMLAKEMVLSLPFIAAAYVFIFVVGRQWRRLVPYLPVLLLMLAEVGGYFLFRSYVVGFSQQAKHPFTVAEIILTFIKTIGYYVLKILVPVHLSAYIQNPLVESVFDPRFVAAFIFLALVLAAIWRTFRRDPLIAFSLVFLLLSLGPLSNIIRISGPKDMWFMTAERFIYITSAPVCLLLAVALGRLIGRLGRFVADRDWNLGVPRRQATTLLAAVLVVACFTVLTLRRNTDWYNNEVMFNKMIADAPNATLLYVVLGNIYRIDKKYDEAERTLQKALEYIAPRNREEPTWIYNDLAGIYAEQGRFDEALKVMKLASRTREHNSAVQYNYGEIYRAMGDCRTAARYYERSLAIYRDNLAAFNKLGICFQNDGNWEGANKSYLAALNLTPHDANLLNEIGYDYYRLGNLEKSEAYLQAALTEQPRHTGALINLALVKFKKDQADQAVKLLEQVLAREPKNVDALAAMGHILASDGKYPEAGRFVMAALSINPKHIQARLTYAAVAVSSQPAHARQVLLDILRDSPGQAEAAFIIGLSYEAENNRAEAIQWYEKTLSIEPGHRKALAKLKELGVKPPTEPSEARDE